MLIHTILSSHHHVAAPRSSWRLLHGKSDSPDRFGRRPKVDQPWYRFASFSHTVEELQQFSNTRTPSPPWVKVLRVVVPMSCCDQAAEYLIDALGGESVTKKIVGGTKWWQIRGVPGCGVTSNCPWEELTCGCSSVDGEWIVAKKDWQEAKKRAKSKERRDKSKERKEKERDKSAQQSATSDSASAEDTFEPSYTPDMDEQRCILYFHGGKSPYGCDSCVAFVS